MVVPSSSNLVHGESESFLHVILHHCRLSIFDSLHVSTRRRPACLGSLPRDILWMFSNLCVRSITNRTALIAQGQDPDELLYMMYIWRDTLNASSPPECPTDRKYENILLQALSSEYESARRAYLERRGFDPCRYSVIYTDESIAEESPRATIHAMDLYNSNARATSAQCLMTRGETSPSTANNELKDDSIRCSGSKRRTG